MVDAWFNVSPWTESYPGCDRAARPGRGRRARRRVHVGRRLAVPRLVRDRCVTTPISATRSSRSSTRSSRRSPRRGTAASRGSRPEATARWSRPMLRPDLFGGVRHARRRRGVRALLSGGVRPGGARAAREVQRLVRRVLERLPLGPSGLSDKDDVVLVNTYAMAAAYSANEDGTIDLPFDVATGELVPRRVRPLARAGPGADGARPVARRGAARAPRACGSIPGRATSTILDLGATAFRQRTRRHRRPRRRDPLRAVRRRSTAGSSWRYPLALTWLVDGSRSRRGAPSP